MKVDDIKSLLRRIRSNVASAEELQGHFNLAHSRDFRNVVETGERADRWGAAHTAAVVATALMQVVVVRTFFGYGIKLTWQRY